jgi:hypothetical protein
MKKSIVSLLLVVCFGIISASAQTDHCFKNDGLKNVNSISFTLTGNKVTNGSFEINGYDDSEPTESFTFTGTKTANALTIKFTDGIPEEFKTIKTIVWTLGSSLKVPTYGKNNVTDKWSVYSATYEKCGDEEMSSGDTPQQISFPKGKSETDESITLAPGESKKFVVGAKIGQIFYVDAESKDVEISMVKGKVATDATLSEPGHYDTTLLANGDFVFEVKNTSENEVNTTIKVIISGGH